MNVSYFLAVLLQSVQRMRIAIIGGGISALTCARLMHRQHEVTVFDAASSPGGHSNTVSFRLNGRDYNIDTGFIVYNDRTYPNFIRLLSQLGILGRPTRMSFSVRCDRTGLEYSGTGLSGLFAQRSNLLRPKFLRMIADILRFNRLGREDADRVSDTMTVGEYLRERSLGNTFADWYLLPMGAAIWSCPAGAFRDFPVRFILEFYRNHGLLDLRNRPQWYTIPGGSRVYVDRLTQPFRDRIRSGTPVLGVIRQADGVRVLTAAGWQDFDEVIFGCHSDQALRILGDNATSTEREVLSGFPYEENDVVLHHDSSVLPRQRAAWAAWNYRIRSLSDQRPMVSYNMNLLQHIDAPVTFSVTLNAGDSIAADAIISRHRYSHPVFTADRSVLQSRHSQLIRTHRSSFCGAYWRHGFHEDGVVSALEVCRRFGIMDLTFEKTIPAVSSPARPAAPPEVSQRGCRKGAACA